MLSQSQRSIFATSASSSLNPSPPILIQLIAFVLFAVLTVAFTWPLSTNLGGLLGGTNDPPLFTWILATVSQSLISDPLTLFEGGIFYPYGRAISFSEPLIFPALVTGAPTYALTGNPVFAYNLTLIVFQALSGWTAWYAAWRITGSGAGAVLAGVVFAFSAFKMGYYNFLNIHLSFAVPLAFVSFIAFLESARLKPLLLTVVLLAIQASAIWYGAIPLGLVLAMLLVVYVILRPGLWILGAAWRLAIAALLLAALVAPIAIPYFTTHTEMAFVRELAEVNKFRADVLSLLDPGLNSVWPRWVDAGREPGLFAGFICLAMAVFANVFACIRVIWRAQTWTRVGLLIVLSVGTLIFATLCWQLVLTYAQPVGAEIDSNADADRLPTLILALLATGLLFFLIIGLSWRRGRSTRSVRIEEWILIISGFVFVGMLLVLGPEIHVDGKSAGASVYPYIYANVPGFNGLRIAIRLAFIYLFFIGLLAAFGIRILTLKAKRFTGILLWLLPVAAIVELWPDAIDYQVFDWNHPPAVYEKLAEIDDPGVVLELPTFDEHIDSTYMLWSLRHGSPIVNGVSGFYPPHIQKLATLTKSFPQRPNLEPLEQIHNLKNLVVHLDAIKQPEVVTAWEKLSRSPPTGLHFVERFDNTLLFQLRRPATPAWRWRRLLPSATAKALSGISFDIELPSLDSSSAAPLPAIEHAFSLSVNGEVRDRFALKPGANTVVTTMPEISAAVHPVALELTQSYEITESTEGDPRYLLGTTGRFSRADILVESASRSHGSVATIWVNGINHSPRQPGYNVVTLDAQSGRLLGRAAFNVARNPDQLKAMQKYIEKTPDGSIVIVALKGDARVSSDVTMQATRLLIGSLATTTTDTAEPASHLIIGIRGAQPGTAVDLADTRLLTKTIGVDRRSSSMTVRRFELLSRAAN